MARAMILIAAIALLVGCAPRYRGDVSYDPDALYRDYKTVAWVEGQGQSTETVRSIAEKGVRAELARDGLSFVDDASQADLLARINLGRRKRTKVSGSVTPGGEMVGMEVILLDRKSGDWVWNGWAAKTYSTDLEAQTEVPLALEYIFRDFPPTK